MECFGFPQYPQTFPHSRPKPRAKPVAPAGGQSAPKDANEAARTRGEPRKAARKGGGGGGSSYVTAMLLLQLFLIVSRGTERGTAWRGAKPREPPQAGRRGGWAARRRGGERRGRGKPPRAREGRRSGRERGKPEPRGKPSPTIRTAARGRGKPEPPSDEHRAAQRGANPSRRTHTRRRAAQPTAKQPWVYRFSFRARKKERISSAPPIASLASQCVLAP